jgi:hypothetical protein
VSVRLRKQIEVEREQLRRLLETHRQLLEQCGQQTPNAIELSALGTLLHGFYTGIENVFKRIVIELDSQRPCGEAWHRRLLDSMGSPGPARPPVISPELKASLEGYLQFRHVFRQAYSFDLQWGKMATMVLDCERILTEFERELDLFLGSIPSLE